MRRITIPILFILVFILGCTIPEQPQLNHDQIPSDKFLTIANWNLQIFGDSKASNQTLMQRYVDIINDYDIIFIQEIRDADGSAFNDLCLLLPEYNCKISSRAGRSTSKEQYGVIYKKGIEITDWKDFNPDEQDRWERPPIKVTFSIGNYSITTYNIHIKPDDVQQELAYLELIAEDNGNILIFGDLNADCSYYNPIEETEFDNWYWAINDNQDTTSTSTNCAYDRILLNTNTIKEISSNGIYNDITEDMSDHYLIWVELQI